MTANSSNANQGLPPAPASRTIGDVVHAIMKGAIGSVPLPCTSLASELFSLVLTPPMEKRRDEWSRQVGEAIRDLQFNRGLSIESLRSNDAFLDSVMHASQIAIRNSQHEKHEALRNAITNSAIESAIDDSLRQMFLNQIDVFTVWHLKILKLFDNPVHWYHARGTPMPQFGIGSMGQLLETAYPELKGRKDFYGQVWKDLNASGLVDTDGLHTMMSGSGVVSERTTPIGKQFVAFVSAAPSLR